MKTFYHRLSWDEIDLNYLRSWLTLARDEDLKGAGLKHPPTVLGDPTTASLEPLGSGCAHFVSRQSLTVCGLPLMPLILETYGKQWDFISEVNDGDSVDSGTVIARVSGEVAILLQAERLLLNCLQHFSGIATQTSRYVTALGNSSTRLLDTRKTTPGLRMLEKYAVACGGGWNHRLGLFDRILFKDNHWACRSNEDLTDAIYRARRDYPELPIEVEVDTCRPIEQLLEIGVDIILLDNFFLKEIKQAVEKIAGRAYTEASGNVSLEYLNNLASVGLDFISIGALTHQSVWVDIGLDWLE